MEERKERGEEIMKLIFKRATDGKFTSLDTLDIHLTYDVRHVFKNLKNLTQDKIRPTVIDYINELGMPNVTRLNVYNNKNNYEGELLVR